MAETINAGPVTTFSTYSIVSENRVVLKPDGLDMDIAVLFGCALATGSGMVLNELKPKRNRFRDRARAWWRRHVSSAGSARHWRKQIIAIDTDPKKIELAESLGVTAVQYESEESVLSFVRHFFPDGADFCIEAGGHYRHH